jgi:hypothetical protein
MIEARAFANERPDAASLPRGACDWEAPRDYAADERDSGEVRRYSRRSAEAVRNRVADAPMLALLIGTAAGFAAGWLVQGARQSGRPSHGAGQRREMLGQRSGKPLIESDRVEGTRVYDPAGKAVGTIKRVMIEKLSGRVAYAVMQFGGLLGIGADECAVPWSKLSYDPELEGYRTDITEEQLRSAPEFSRKGDHDWSDIASERELHDYYDVTYYWLLR